MFARKAARAVAVSILQIASVTVFFACEPVAVEGTPYGTSKPPKRTKDAGRTSDPTPTRHTEDGDDGAVIVPPPATDAGAAPPEDAGTSPAPTDTTPPPPPPPPPAAQPSCESPDPGACFVCCINHNPGAIPFEHAFDDCLFGCFDYASTSACRMQDVSLCDDDAERSDHHACLEANDCAQQNFCF